MSAAEIAGWIRQASPRRIARIAGALYLLIFIFAPAGASTATPVKMLITLACDTGVAVVFYWLFKPVSRPVSFIAAVFRLIFVAIMAVNSLNYFGVVHGFGAVHSASAFDRLYVLAIVPFGIHCVLIGLLILRSSFLPRFLGILMAIAGAAYLTFVSPSFIHHVAPYILIPGVIAEGLLTLWLLIAGVNNERWKQQASVAAVGIPCKMVT